MKTILICLLSLSYISANSQALSDSTSMPLSKTERFFQNRWVQSTYIGVPLILGGLVEQNHNYQFRSLRNKLLPTFHNELDNYTQYSPAIVMLGLKAAGVESRSSWSKMLSADAFSVLFVTAMTRSVKSWSNVQRPDGSNDHSFPSGHTATAFMTATMLNKEYGHRSPWVGYGAYTVAISTGVMRMMNNRHWMSDVLAGAGMGIIGTEFGYWLSDLVFPKEGKSDKIEDTYVDPARKPSFVGTFAGVYVPIVKHDISKSKTLKASSGATMGVEGAWYPVQNWGVGGQVNASVIHYIINDAESDEIQTESSSHFFSTKMGVYYTTHVYERMFFTAKTLGGMVYYPKQSNPVIKTNRRVGFCTLAGINLGIRAKDNLDIKIGVDYEMFKSPSRDIVDSQALIFNGSANIRF